MEKQQYRILVVDDDPKVLQSTARILRDADYEVLEAHCGQECLDSVRANKPDLVLLDVVMPDFEGPEVCRKIKEDPETERTYVILLSGMRITSEQQADGLDVGADGYIPRPFAKREFLSRVASLLRIKQAEDALRAEKENVERLNAELVEALRRVKRLEGILPICMHCHRIRSDEETWQKLEEYLQDHTEVVLSHGLCSECLEKHYPTYDGDQEDDLSMLKDL